MAGLYIETGIWSVLWDRLAQTLQVWNPETDMPLLDIESDDKQENTQRDFPLPDWGLMSPRGMMAALQLAVSVFTKVGH